MDCMMDLETYGLKPGSVIRSIGAVGFNPIGEWDQSSAPFIDRNISLNSCIAAGLTIDARTVAWWEEQTLEAQRMLQENRLELKAAALSFNDWWEVNGFEYLWVNGAAFDPVLWEVACDKVGVKVPWVYNRVMDIRTVVYAHKLLNKPMPPEVPQEGLIAHYGLHDCVYQIKKVRAFMKEMT